MDRVSVALYTDSIADTLALARLADQTRIELLWNTEFHNKNGYVRLAAMAAATQRIKVGTGIAYAFVRTPLLNAAAAADLDELSGGRMVLGLGTGTKRMNEAWYSTPFEHPAPKLKEVCEILRLVWASHQGPAVRYSGRFYNIDVQPYSRPFQLRERIPIYLAGVNPTILRMIGSTADGLVGHPIASRLYLKEIAAPAIAEGAQKAGRDPTEVDLASYIITSVHPDRATARREVKHQIAFYSTVKTYDVILDLHGFEREKEGIRAAFRKMDIQGMVDAVSEEMVDAMAIAGTPDECRAQLKRWDGLIDLPILYSPHFGIDPQRVVENHRAVIETFG